MRSGFRIGRIFGIDIRIDWSWVFIFILITWNLSSLFGDIHSNWGPFVQWGLALVAALLFFVSVLAHELAHSLVSQAQGTPVRGITLFLFGGVSNIQREPETPRSEFLMAILGPVTSLVIGFLLLILAGVGIDPNALQRAMEDPSGPLGQMGPVTTVLLWLGSVNMALGLFNLIPGFPLDGGRVLRSILWGITDDLRRATRWASWVGQGIGWLMIISGIAMVFGAQIPFVGSGLVNGLWLAFIGWFLNNAASRSYQKIVIHDILEGVPVERMVRTNPPTVAPDVSIEELVNKHIMQSDDQSFPVLDGDRLVGLITLGDVRSVSRNAWETTSVRDVMTPAQDLVTANADEDASEALEKLTQLDVRQLPVMRDGALVGLLRRRDVIKWLQLHSKLNMG
ncbi:MAG: site-2 protease family protein [Anaerolineae bacterium]|jgi:Zn-dependent protease/CBS domain-containing protein